jgi:haloalkane dehalogenase
MTTRRLSMAQTCSARSGADAGRAAIEHHREAGRFFSVDGVRSFVLEQGSGPAVLCMHGLPESSFGYRKLLPELAARELRGIAFDLPGAGLADRPDDFDYSWTGLGRFAIAAVDALGLDRFHLLVHDVGGPVGFELAAARADRVASLTVLNTLVEPDKWRRPWFLKPFVAPGLGELAVRFVPRIAFRWLMLRIGIQDPRSISGAELDAYLDMIRHRDGGRAILRTVRTLTRPAASVGKGAMYEQVLRDGRYPVQILWGKYDPAVPLHPYGEMARRNAGLKEIIELPAKHFPQEDQAAAIAEQVAAIANTCL